MTIGEKLYLALIVTMFSAYSVLLFWAMLTSSGSSNTGDDRLPTEH